MIWFDLMKKTTVAGKNYFLLLVLFLLIPFVYAAPAIISEPVDLPDPISVDGGNITVFVNITTNGSLVDTAYLKILDPEAGDVLNDTITIIDANNSEYTFLFDPATVSQYIYRVWVNTIDGNVSQTGIFAFQSREYPYFLDIIDSGPQIIYDVDNISINTTVITWGAQAITDARLEIIEPLSESKNFTMNFDGNIGDEWNYSFIYGPANTTSVLNIDTYSPAYKYKIWIEEGGVWKSSAIKTFYAIGYPPTLDFLVAYGSTKTSLGVIYYNSLGQDIEFYLDITDDTNSTNNNSDVVNASIIYGMPFHTPIREALNTSGSLHYWSHTITDHEVFYVFNIFVEDAEGNIIKSKDYYFTDVPFYVDDAKVDIKVDPACCGMQIIYVDPDTVYEGQPFKIYAYLENCGSVAYNSTRSTLNIYRKTAEGPDIFFKSLPTYNYSGILVPGNYTGQTYTEYSDEYPEGEYIAVMNSTYIVNTIVEGMPFFCNGATNGSANFTVKKYGGVGPSDLVIIREMPPQIYQVTNCSTTNPWNGSCTQTNVRLIVYNSGNENTSNITIIESMYLNTSALKEDAEPIDYICNSNSAYTCTVLPGDKDYQYYVQFIITEKLFPRAYVILDYSIVPSEKMNVYSSSMKTKYVFSASGTYLDAYNFTKSVYEKMPVYNPAESREMNLINKPSFNYDIVPEGKDLADARGRRSFMALEDTTFTVNSTSVSGDTRPSGTWYIKIDIPSIWQVTSAQFVSGSSCSLTIHNYESADPYPWVMCTGTSNVSNGENVVFSFTAKSLVDEMFLLPVNASDGGAPEMDAQDIPGLFVVAKQPENRVPTPQPIPQPTPEPDPTPEPEQEPIPIVEIILTPIEDKYVVYQGQAIPTYFDVENLGATVTNVLIEPVLPGPEWNFSETIIGTLLAGATVNRTLMIRPGENTTPAIYMIPIKAIVYGEVADISYIQVTVLFGKHLAKIEILESPFEVEMDQLSNLTIPIFVKNTGRKVLHNVTMRLENAEDCLSFQDSLDSIIEINETRSLELKVTSLEGPKMCKTSLIIESKEEAYAFAPITIIVKPAPPLLPFGWKLTPILALLWTLILVVYARIRKRKAQMGERPKSDVPRMILYLLLLGEFLIVGYIFLWILGFAALF